MERKASSPRPEWCNIVESQGFTFHTLNGEIYWDESAYYALKDEEIALIQTTTSELHQMGLEVVSYIVKQGLYDRFDIPDWFATLIEWSWKRQEPDLYGRLDLVYSGLGTVPKLLEYNSDTACSLLEAGSIQAQWKADIFPEKSQFNEIHQHLLQYWNYLKPKHLLEPLYFSCLWDFVEVRENLIYLAKTAKEAGLSTELLCVRDLCWDDTEQSYTTSQGEAVHSLVKLRPWERFIEDCPKIAQQISPMQIFEPAWKYLLGNKAILPLLWRLFPKHPNLLPTYYIPEPLQDGYVKKATVSGSGANIRIYNQDKTLLEKSPVYKNKKNLNYIYQEFCPLPEFEGNYTVLGSWIIGGKPAGIGILEDKSFITQETSRFLPHIII